MRVAAKQNTSPSNQNACRQGTDTLSPSKHFINLVLSKECNPSLQLKESRKGSRALTVEGLQTIHPSKHFVPSRACNLPLAHNKSSGSRIACRRRIGTFRLSKLLEKPVPSRDWNPSPEHNEPSESFIACRRRIETFRLSKLLDELVPSRDWNPPPEHKRHILSAVGLYPTNTTRGARWCR